MIVSSVSLATFEPGLIQAEEPQRTELVAKVLASEEFKQAKLDMYPPDSTIFHEVFTPNNVQTNNVELVPGRVYACSYVWV